MKSYDLVSIGNISIDLYFKGDSLTFQDDRFQLAIGGKYYANYFYESLGGGGANVAIGAAKMGLRTAVFGIIGNTPFKKVVMDSLQASRVSTEFCSFVKDYYNISTILLTDDGKSSIIHYTPPHQHLTESLEKMEHLANSKIVYLGNLPIVTLTEREKLLGFLKEKKVTSVVNLGSRDCRKSKSQLKNYLNETDIIILNGHEFSELVKAKYHDIHFHEDVIKWYIPTLSEKTIIITEGAKGSFGYRHGKVIYQQAEKIEKVVDATGAGDGYTSAFIAEYSKSEDIKKAMTAGAHYAKLILSKVGAN